MLSTLNALLLPFFLFAVYFCAACLIIYPSNPQRQGSQEQPLTASELNLTLEVTANSFTQEVSEEERTALPSPENSENSSKEAEFSQVQEPEATETQRSPQLQAQAETILNNLNKRQSRQLCKPLGIQQKCGKVEKSLTFIKAEIRGLFKQEPARVIAVLEEKFPELRVPLPEVKTQMASTLPSLN
jgi:hypothetical protein